MTALRAARGRKTRSPPPLNESRPLDALRLLAGALQIAAMVQLDAFMAIADANRRLLLEELRRGPKTVSKLAADLPVSRPAVSQHLKILLDAGLVTVRADGAKRIYALNVDGFLRLNIWIDQFWQG